LLNVQIFVFFAFLQLLCGLEEVIVLYVYRGNACCFLHILSRLTRVNDRIIGNIWSMCGLW